MMKRRFWLLVYPLTILFVLISSGWGSLTVDTFIENTPIDRKYCIIIDPGHGGIDGGATSCTGVLESQYNLDIALRLNDLLHLLGFETKLTRIEDVSIYTKGETIAQKKISDLKERVRIVNETPNALLLSIHQNHYSDPRYCGGQVFYPETAQSKILATQLQNALIASLDPTNHRQAKKITGIYLMENIRCTGILIECGFLSNIEDELKLSSEEYQRKLCSVIAATVSCFLSNT